MDGERWVDYGRGLSTAEEAVSSTIDQILTDGGMLLWQKYLERKAFSFAATAISEALVSRLRMCYVHHDHGEALHDGALGAEWQIEEEPSTCEVDSWARMHLPVRRTKNEEANQSAAKAPKLRRAPASRAKFNTAQTKVAEFQPRIQPLECEVLVDPEEERMREAKAQEEARKRDKERAAKESEKALEEERRKVQQLHEEMSKRPHTFDTEGNLIWVDELKPDRLPKLVEFSNYQVKKDPKLTGTLGRDEKPVMDGAGASPVADKRTKRQKGGGKRRNKKGEAGPEFTDGFSKLQHGQPPIIETMVVVPGVLLEQMGKVKAGPEPESRFMSRKEYVLLAEAEVPTEASFRKGAPAASSDSQGAGGGDPPAAPPSGAGAPLEATGLPQIPGAGRVTAVPAYPGQPKPGAATSQKAPPAPPAPVRRKYEALGFGRDPRYHAPNLGGNLGLGAAQPVLGATMGHGLVKSSSNKEAFFFPPAVPDMPGVLRSQSEAALGSARRGPSETTPRGPEDQGQLRPELSPAYRNFRHAMNLDGGTYH